MSTAYWESQVLLTAVRIGLFEHLATGAKRAEDVASLLQLQLRPMTLFLNACVALELVERQDEGYVNAAVSRDFLVAGKPSYMGNAFRYCDNLYGAWGDLEKTLVSGAPAVEPVSYLGGNDEQTRHFVYGMHNRALAIGQAMTRIVDLSGRRKLLDIGGGPGTFSALFVQRYDELEATVLDLPGVAAIAGEILDTMGVSNRVVRLPGDYLKTPFPQENDVVLICGVLHRESPVTCRDMIRRAVDALTPGGLLVTSDVFTDAGHCSPPFSALFGLNMALTARCGGVHADADVAEWMAQVGLVEITTKPFPQPMPHRIVLGCKGGEQVS